MLGLFPAPLTPVTNPTLAAHAAAVSAFFPNSTAAFPPPAPARTPAPRALAPAPVAAAAAPSSSSSSFQDDGDVWFAPPAAKKIAVEDEDGIWAGPAVKVEKDVDRERDRVDRERADRERSERERSRSYDRRHDDERGKSQSRGRESRDRDRSERSRERDRYSRDRERDDRERDRDRDDRERDRFDDRDRRSSSVAARYSSPALSQSNSRPSSSNIIPNTDGLTPQSQVPDIVTVPSSNRKSKYKLTPAQRKEMFELQVAKAAAAKEREAKEKEEKERAQRLELEKQEEAKRKVLVQAELVKQVQHIAYGGAPPLPEVPNEVMRHVEEQRRLAQMQLEAQKQQHQQQQLSQQQRNFQPAPLVVVADDDDDIWVGPSATLAVGAGAVGASFASAAGSSTAGSVPEVVDACAAEMIAEAELDEGIWFQEPAMVIPVASNVGKAEPELADEDEWVDAWDSNAWDWDDESYKKSRRVQVGTETEDGVWTWGWKEPEDDTGAEGDAASNTYVPPETKVKREAEQDTGSEKDHSDAFDLKRIKTEPKDVATFLPDPVVSAASRGVSATTPTTPSFVVASAPAPAAASSTPTPQAPPPLTASSAPGVVAAATPSEAPAGPKVLKSALAAHIRPAPVVSVAEWDHSNSVYVVIPTAFGLLEMMKSFPSEVAETPTKFKWLELVRSLWHKKPKGFGISSVSLSNAMSKNPQVTSRHKWKEELQAFLREAVKRDKLLKVNRTYYLGNK